MSTTDEDVILHRQKIKPGNADDLREWFEDNVEDEPAVQSALRERGLRVESAFIQSTDSGEYLLYYAEVDDSDRADAHAVESGPECKRIAERFLEGGAAGAERTAAELLFDIIIEADQR